MFMDELVMLHLHVYSELLFSYVPAEQLRS